MVRSWGIYPRSHKKAGASQAWSKLCSKSSELQDYTSCITSSIKETASLQEKVIIFITKGVFARRASLDSWQSLANKDNLADTNGPVNEAYEEKLQWSKVLSSLIYLFF